MKLRTLRIAAIQMVSANGRVADSLARASIAWAELVKPNNSTRNMLGFATLNPTYEADVLLIAADKLFPVESW